MTLLDTAIAIALRYHHGQVNKHDGEPYILHPHRVATRVRDAGLPEDYQAVAWLHDVLEDTELTFSELLTMVPSEIALAVLMLTKTKGMSNEDYYKMLAGQRLAGTVKLFDIDENFGRNHLIEDDATRLRMAKKYSLGIDMLKHFRGVVV